MLPDRPFVPPRLRIDATRSLDFECCRGMDLQGKFLRYTISTCLSYLNPSLVRHGRSRHFQGSPTYATPRDNTNSSSPPNSIEHSTPLQLNSIFNPSSEALVSKHPAHSLSWRISSPLRPAPNTHGAHKQASRSAAPRGTTAAADRPYPRYRTRPAEAATRRRGPGVLGGPIWARGT